MGRLHLICGASSMGKTGLAFHMASAVAEAGRDAHIFSADLFQEEIASTLLAQRTGIPIARIQAGEIHSFDACALRSAQDHISGLPIYIDDGTADDRSVIDRVRAVTAPGQSARDAPFMIIDAAHDVISADRKPTTARAMGRMLAFIARRSGATILVLYETPPQLPSHGDHRSFDHGRTDRRMFDRADTVLLLHRDQYYVERQEPVRADGEAMIRFEAGWDQWAAEAQRVHGHAELIVAKFGNQLITAAISLAFDDVTRRFRDIGDVTSDGSPNTV